MKETNAKHSAWVGVAWKALPSRESVCKEVTFEVPKTEAQALRAFKATFPKLRNHTVQPKEDK